MDYLHALRQSFVRFLTELAENDSNPMQFSHTGYGRPLRGTVTGRYAILRVNMGKDNDRLIKELTESVVNQILPWDPGKAAKVPVYLDRQWVTIKVPLPKEAQHPIITLHELTEIRHGGQVVILGPNERGVTVSLPFSEIVHCLIGGETNSGKTYTMRSIAYQIANGKTRIILLDGKRGQGMGILNGIPGQVGPLAIERDQIVNALGWAHGEMKTRYAQILERGGIEWKPEEGPPHIAIFFDEFQEFRKDAAIMSLLQSLAAQGRSARIHLFCGTQRPTVKMFGSDEGGTTRDQFGTRIAQKVQSYQASYAATGDSTQRADWLQPAGDAIVIGNSGGHQVNEHVQIAYVPEETLSTFCKGTPDMDAWPAYDGDDSGDSNGVGRPLTEFNPDQVAAAVYAARTGWGRGKLQGLLDDLGESVPGSGPAGRLLALGQEINATLRAISRSQAAGLLEGE